MLDRGPVGDVGGGHAPLVRLFLDHWRRVTFTYALFTVENLLNLAQPLVLGRAINAMLRAESGGLALLAPGHFELRSTRAVPR